MNFFRVSAHFQRFFFEILKSLCSPRKNSSLPHAMATLVRPLISRGTAAAALGTFSFFASKRLMPLPLPLATYIHIYFWPSPTPLWGAWPPPSACRVPKCIGQGRPAAAKSRDFADEWGRENAKRTPPRRRAQIIIITWGFCMGKSKELSPLHMYMATKMPWHQSALPPLPSYGIHPSSGPPQKFGHKVWGTLTETHYQVCLDNHFPNMDMYTSCPNRKPEIRML